MKKIVIVFFVIFLTFACYANLFAVSEAAALFLIISPSTQANGMGNTFITH